MQDDVFDAVLAQMVGVLKVPPERVTPNTPLDHLGADSLKMVEILMPLDDQFDLSFPEDENLPGVSTVGDFCDLVRRYRRAH